MAEEGDIVVCRSVPASCVLTFNKSYQIVGVVCDGMRVAWIKVVNDNGDEEWFQSDRFKSLGDFLGGK